jgi:phosphoglycolate phosphatase
MTPTVLLFDIDGTLVSTGGAGRRAMLGAFERVHGRSDVFDAISFAGMTDRAIARHGLGVIGVDGEAEIDRVLDAYLQLLEDELPRAETYRVLPGVTSLLDALAPVAGTAIGLGTGNVRRGAYAKLTRGGIHASFTFGGFGCDAEDRAELLRAGARRGAERLGRSLADCRVVVIGDTPKDVAAAQRLGAPCIGVATGSHSCEELERAGATRVFESLVHDGVMGALFERAGADR